jgi:hypothetical protein
MKKYLFADGVYVENADTTYLGNLVKNIEMYGFDGLFFDAHFVRDRDEMRKGSIAIITRLIDQAALSGWEHAKVLRERLAELRDINISGDRNLIVRLGNTATFRINAKFDGSGTRPFSYLEEDDPQEDPVAVKRIADFIFMGERSPIRQEGNSYETISSVNYLLMSTIAQQMMQQSIELPETHNQFRRATD